MLLNFFPKCPWHLLHCSMYSLRERSNDEHTCLVSEDTVYTRKSILFLPIEKSKRFIEYVTTAQLHIYITWSLKTTPSSLKSHDSTQHRAWFPSVLRKYWFHEWKTFPILTHTHFSSAQEGRIILSVPSLDSKVHSIRGSGVPIPLAGDGITVSS